MTATEQKCDVRVWELQSFLSERLLKLFSLTGSYTGIGSQVFHSQTTIPLQSMEGILEGLVVALGYSCENRLSFPFSYAFDVFDSKVPFAQVKLINNTQLGATLVLLVDQVGFRRV